MRSVIGHPVLDYLRLLEVRSRHESVRRDMQGVTSVPLTQRQNGMLLRIAGGGDATITRMAEGAGISVASASRHAATLESWGLVTKQQSAGDARAVSLELTDEGRRIREAWRARWVRYYEAAMLAVPADDRAGLVEGVAALQRGLARRPEFAWAEAVAGESDTTPLGLLTSATRWLSLTILHPRYGLRVLELTGGRLNPAQLFALRAFGDGAQMDISELAGRTNADSSVASRVARSLADLEYIARAPHPTDARSTLISLTPAGRHRLVMIESAEMVSIDGVFQEWSTADVNRCLDSFGILARELEVPRSPASSGS